MDFGPSANQRIEQAAEPVAMQRRRVLAIGGIGGNAWNRMVVEIDGATAECFILPQSQPMRLSAQECKQWAAFLLDVAAVLEEAS